MLELIERPVHRELTSVWEYPVAACKAMGGCEEDAMPAAAAVFCSVISIHLVDDMLDDDPRGDFHRLGPGPVANVALAFQAAGQLLLDQGPAPVRAALQRSFATLSLATCHGQSLDSLELETEADYWRVVEAKSPPLFGEALRMGALLGRADAATAERLAHLGRLLGRYIQVNDDLADALEAPACADWKRRHNNLPILYALTADHADRARFAQLSAQVDAPEALAAAQKILFRSGAVSYCALKLVELSRQLNELLAGLSLTAPQPVVNLVELHIKPLHRLLEIAGVEEPAMLTLP
ncbi:MAG TPA: polyprenyl synthetase family protein [Thermoanaerobaculia bacterium]|jgi:geranylgeranyl pyrophosphate synthase|nr:polyprenyl synthetase family protein [Thermoanaerobaculia bacterium]